MLSLIICEALCHLNSLIHCVCAVTHAKAVSSAIISYAIISSEAEDSRVLKLLTSRDGGSASKRRLLKVEGTSKASCQASFGC